MRLPPELLVEDPDLSHHPGGPVDSLVVHADNLEALRALAPALAGSVRLAYLDPPYNTGIARDHYDDALSHDRWLDFMRARVEALVPLLRDDGVVVAQIDKTEQAYLKVLLDEVLGRDAYVTTIAVRMSATSGFKIEHTDRTIVKNTEYLHVYARRLTLQDKVYEPAAYDPHYSLEMVSDRDGLRFRRLAENPEVSRLLARRNLRPTAPSLVELYDRCDAFRRFVAEHADRVCRTHTAPAPARRALADGVLRIDGDRVVTREYRGTTYFLRRTRSGVDQLIPIALKLHPVDRVGGPDERVLTNISGDWWDGFHLDMGNVENEGGVPFRGGKKPERLLRRLLRVFTAPGDLVLDPFAGSGTTAAVALKTGRRFAVIERGDQARTHVVPRLRRVVDGLDPHGVTGATGWAGGGGFRFLTSAADRAR